MTPEEKLEQIAMLMRDRLDEDGLVQIDEHLGDVAESYQSILALCTDDKEGKAWGIFPRKKNEEDCDD